MVKPSEVLSLCQHVVASGIKQVWDPTLRQAPRVFMTARELAEGEIQAGGFAYLWAAAGGKTGLGRIRTPEELMQLFQDAVDMAVSEGK